MGTRITQIERISTDFFQAVELISASICQIRVICVPIVVIICLCLFFIRKPFIGFKGVLVYRFGHLPLNRHADIPLHRVIIFLAILGVWPSLFRVFLEPFFVQPL